MFKGYHRLVQNGREPPIITQTTVGQQSQIDEASGSLLEEREMIAKAQSDNQEAWDWLVRRYNDALIGWFRSNPAVRLPGRKVTIVKPGGFGRNPWVQREAEDLAQETWIKVHQRIGQYDPARGTFWTFLKYWGGLVLLHYYAKLRDRLLFEALLSDMRACYPEIDKESEVLDLIAETPWDEKASELVKECFAEMFRIAYGPDLPAYQSLAWSFVDVLSWKPQEVVDKLSKTPFAELAVRLEGDYDLLFCPRFEADDLDQWLEMLRSKPSWDASKRFVGFYPREADRNGKAARICDWAFRVRKCIVRRATGSLRARLDDLLGGNN